MMERLTVDRGRRRPDGFLGLFCTEGETIVHRKKIQPLVEKNWVKPMDVDPHPHIHNRLVGCNNASKNAPVTSTSFKERKDLDQIEVQGRGKKERSLEQAPKRNVGPLVDDETADRS